MHILFWTAFWEIMHFEHTEICMNIQNFFHVFCTVHNTGLQLSNHQFQIYDQKVSSCLSVQFRIKNNTFPFTFTCMHLANAFFQSDLQKRTKKIYISIKKPTVFIIQFSSKYNGPNFMPKQFDFVKLGPNMSTQYLQRINFGKISTCYT